MELLRLGRTRADAADGSRLLGTLLRLLAAALARAPGVRRRKTRIEELPESRSDQALGDHFRALLLSFVHHLDFPGDRGQTRRQIAEPRRDARLTMPQAASLEVGDQDLD